MEEKRASIWKFQGIMMLVQDLRVNFAEFGDAVTDSFGPEPAASIFDIFFECQFRPGKKADGNTLFIGGSKATRWRATKISRDQSFANFGSVRRQMI